MAITESSTIPEGTRVRVKRGRFPMDPAVVGREGYVTEHSQYYPAKVGVALDGVPETYTFAPEELEVIATPPELPEDKESARKRLSRP